MLHFLDPLRDVTFASTALRMALAVFCGGVIGMEREFKRRPAGFRTHILICLGAAMTTLTSQYLLLKMHYFTDIARLGAQVIAGVGFIGSGAIIVTRRQHIKGLTTAAGLWTSAIVGLAAGAGFYEGAVFATALVLAVESLFAKLEYRMLSKARQVNLYVEYTDGRAMDGILEVFREMGVKVSDLEVTRPVSDDAHHAHSVFMLRLNKKNHYDDLINRITSIPGVILAEDL